MMGKCMMMYKTESASTQTWLCSLYLEFAEYPESIYITNPEFANNDMRYEWTHTFTHCHAYANRSCMHKC